MNTLRRQGPRYQDSPRYRLTAPADTMDDMNEPRDAQGGPQQGSTGTTDSPTQGPRVSGQQMRDVNRLRRSKTDRYIAGVAGGLGRHFDIDPTVIRVLLVVLTFFGGAGILVYGVIWLFVPEDGEDRAPIELSPDVLKIVLIVDRRGRADDRLRHPVLQRQLGLGLPVPAGDHRAGGGRDLRDPRPAPAQRPAPPPPWGTPPAATGAATPTSAPTSAPQEGTTMSTTDTQTDPYPTSSYQTGYQTGYDYRGNQPPPAWMPPPPPAYVPPPRPRRTGLVLFWPTLALIAIGLGTLGIVDVND